MVFCQLPEGGLQIEVQIGDVRGNDPIRGEMFKIQRKSFLRDQMNGDRVAAECVQHEHVKVLGMSFGKFTFESAI